MSIAHRPALTLALLAVAGLGLTACQKNRVAPVGMAPSATTQIGVNGYLWRAAVDTLSFAPLVTADSNGGVVITDWYTSPNNPAERVKITATILDADLRADALRVAASRQINRDGLWVDAPVSAATVQKLEDIILVRARDIRRTTVAAANAN
ncbi:DUF3576 domain-containing protein [Sphingomicrobium lutaoense]|uniref:DUF3576 domain-containing protein n=1 Tax=Sphingomicrobium lutaoense TaxID=515949 RepID=A0A839Z7G8_9SPHN|nr:DUF3576 domain-containing protein [Sphingomicrobium lutaoense]MBB3764784.1 hypothetical protein [Sphingomicrobium lutaoense]